MARNRVRDQYKNVAVLLRRIDHIDTDYDVFVVVEESVEVARTKAAFNARKFFGATDAAMVSWEDWLDKTKTKAVILGYTNKQPMIYYKGYLDSDKQPVPAIVQNMKESKNGE